MKYSEDIMDSKATYQGRIAELPSSSELKLLLSHRSFSIFNVFTHTGGKKQKKTRGLSSALGRKNGETDEWVKNGSVRYMAELHFLLHQQNRVKQGKVGMDLNWVFWQKKKINWQNTPCDEYFTRLQQWRGSPTVQDGCCRSDWRRCINMSGAELWVCLFGCISAA